MTLQLNTGSDVLAQVAMTLAAIAYAPGRSYIVTQLSDANLATAGRWALVWYGANDANRVFIARDKATGQQAVSNPRPDDGSISGSVLVGLVPRGFLRTRDG